jgi:hypothetical protein
VGDRASGRRKSTTVLCLPWARVTRKILSRLFGRRTYQIVDRTGEPRGDGQQRYRSRNQFSKTSSEYRCGHRWPISPPSANEAQLSSIAILWTHQRGKGHHARAESVFTRIQIGAQLALQIEPSRLAARLTTYFSCEQARPHPWFQPWSTILSELGLCYSKDAAHIDLSPRSTNSSRSNLKDLFVEMLQTDAAIWVEALTRAANCELVLAAGSATKDFYINEFICQKLGHAGVRLVGDWRRRSGEGQTALHKIILLGGREIPFFFCSSGPSKSNGVALVDACRTNMSLLRRLSYGSKLSREASC